MKINKILCVSACCMLLLAGCYAEPDYSHYNPPHTDEPDVVVVPDAPAQAHYAPSADRAAAVYRPDGDSAHYASPPPPPPPNVGYEPDEGAGY
jgi:hypothetical protein